MRSALLLAAALLALPAASARQVVFVEETQAYESEGVVAPGESRTLRFRVVHENVTRVAFRVSWDAAEDPATLRLSGLDPQGRPMESATSTEGLLEIASAPLAGVPGPVEVREEDAARAREEARTREGQGEWRATVRHVGGEAPAAFRLVVLVTHYEAVSVRVVTLQAASAPLVAPAAWALALFAGGFVAASLGLLLALPPKPRSVPPAGDNMASSKREQERCAPEG